jgi:hypothetical protein
VPKHFDGFLISPFHTCAGVVVVVVVVVFVDDDYDDFALLLLCSRESIKGLRSVFFIKNKPNLVDHTKAYLYQISHTRHLFDICTCDLLTSMEIAHLKTIFSRI